MTETVIYRRRRDPDFYTKGARCEGFGYFHKVGNKYVEMVVPPKDAVIIDV